MPRAFAFSTLLLLLASCTQMPLSPTLDDRTINLGTNVSTSIAEPFDGSWQVSDHSPWLTVSRGVGQGSVTLSLTADRNAVTPLTADRPQLGGTVTIHWTSPDGQTTGNAVWTVTADQYRLSGRVLDTATITASDIQSRSRENALTAQGVTTQARGVIVTYRSASLRDGALKDTSLQGQSVNGQSASRLQTLGIKPSERQPLGDRAILLKTAFTPETLAALKQDPNVKSVLPNRVLKLLSTPIKAQALAQPLTPTDQYAPLQWAYTLLGYRAVWRDMETNPYQKAITVAVLDSGVRFDHPDLAGKLYGPGDGALDLVDVNGDASDPGISEGGQVSTHGTHVTGIIVANWGTNTAATCAGCSPTGVVGASYTAPLKVLPVRVLGPNGTDVATVTTAVEYAAGLPVTVNDQSVTNPHPAQVINLSLGGKGVSAEEAAPMCDAIAAAKERGILTFVAAGNEGTTDPYYPASCPAAVAVGSVTLSGGSAPVAAWYSNHYPKVELVAPGGAGLNSSTFNGGTLNGQAFPDNIISTGWNYTSNEPSYDVMAGTSQATPQVSALAALLLSKGLTTGADDTLSRITDTVTDLGAKGRDEFFGYGLINPAAALGAPAIADTLGLRLQDAQGRTFQPALNALGQFTAYLGDGTYQVTGGRDRNGNVIFGEVGEPAEQREVNLGPGAPVITLPDLTPQ